VLKVEGQIQLIKMDMIDRPVKIARELIDPEKVRELAESIRESGLLQPVILRPSNGRYEMVAGDRRYLAHKLLDLKVIKAIVRELDDRETVLVRTIENLQRENLSPSEEGRVYLVLKEEGGLSIKEISRRTGKRENTIARYLNLLKYPDYVRVAVDKKELKFEALDILAEIEDESFFKYYFDMTVSNGATQKTVRLWVDDYFKTKGGSYSSDGGGIPGVEVEVIQKPVFMTCEACHSPVEIKVVRNVVMCPDCRKKVVHT